VGLDSVLILDIEMNIDLKMQLTKPPVRYAEYQIYRKFACPNFESILSGHQDNFLAYVFDIMDKRKIKIYVIYLRIFYE
jgi:hypothetical protein